MFTLLRGNLSHAAMISKNLHQCTPRAEPRRGSKAKRVSVPGSCSRSGGAVNATAKKVNRKKNEMSCAIVATSKVQKGDHLGRL